MVGALTLLGCSKKDTDDPLVVANASAGLPVERLESEAFPEDAVLGEPSSIALVGGRLIVTDAQGEPFIHVYDPTQRHALSSFGQHGEGPGQFGSTPRLSKTAGDEGSESKVWLLDVTLRRLTAVNLADSTGHPFGAPTQSRILGLNGIHLVQADSEQSVLVVSDTATGIVVATVGPDGVTRLRQDRVVPLKDDRMPASNLRAAYQATPCGQPRGNMAALVYRAAGRIDLLDLSVGTFNHVSVPYEFVPTLTRHPVRLRYEYAGAHRGVRQGYLDCAATATRFYALFSGQRLARDRRPDPPTSFVQVFDWSGRLLRVIELRHGAVGIAVDEAKGNLYTIAWSSARESGGIFVTHMRSEHQ